MNLSAYLKPMGEPQRVAFAMRCGTTWNHMRNVAYSGKPCGVMLAVNLERETGGRLRRWHVRPKDWHLIWPELVGTEGAPPVPQGEDVRDAA